MVLRCLESKLRCYASMELFLWIYCTPVENCDADDIFFASGALYSGYDNVFDDPEYFAATKDDVILLMLTFTMISRRFLCYYDKKILINDSLQ